MTPSGPPASNDRTSSETGTDESSASRRAANSAARPRCTFGADEAGRGPILGPMVIAVVVVDRARAIALRRLGAADSKQFGAGPEAIARRGELAELIRERALAHRIAVVDVERVDRYTFKGQLNVLEREVVHGLLVELGAAAGDRIVCDGANLFGPLKHQFPRLEAVDNGESVHVAVAAASILAKDRRDRAFSEIARRYEPEFGPLRGSGYCNAATRAFLSAYRSRYGCLPPETRKSWTGSTAGNVQRSLPFPRE